MSGIPSSAPRSRDDIQIAIICALVFEFDAVVASLDVDWDDTTSLRKVLGDPNTYTLGRIGQHDVAIVLLPGMGKVSSASATVALCQSFVNIHLALVVGVCGGAPKTADGEEVMLGDVVISTKVIQADFGRQLPNRIDIKDTSEDALARPSPAIRSFLNKLSGLKTRERLSQNARTHLANILNEKEFESSQYLGITKDELYTPQYRHKHRKQGQCAICDKCENDWDPVCDDALKANCVDLGCSNAMQQSRSRLMAARSETNTPRLFQGVFASGDQVVKSSSHREELSSRYQAVGFEMEGAGAWDNSPTIIVKSVCDYADTHKNKKWQLYAAASAAAHAKALLAEWVATDKRPVDDYRPSITTSQAAPLGSTSEAARPRVWPLRTRNPLFLGRANELAEIKDRFHMTSDSAIQREPQVLVLEGVGGTGKSELCLRYLHEHEQRYWAIFWIDGTSVGSLKSGFERIAKQLGLGDADPLNSLYNLASQKQPWLLIIDNADDPDLDLAPYLPTKGIGHVIITTRNPKLDVYDTTMCLSVKGLAKYYALELLFKTAKIPNKKQESSIKSAEEILRILDFHTLAIIQAGTFIRKTRDIDCYLKFFKEQRKRVLEYCNPQVRSQYGSVYATFEVSASKLRQEADERHDQAAADALELLDLFAFMDSRGAFERIFCSAKDFAIKCALLDTAPINANDPVDVDDLEAFAQKYSSLLLPPIAFAGNDMAGKYRWREACDKLQGLSILSVEENSDGDEILSFHPLILAWALARQSEKRYQESWLSVATTVCLSNWGFYDYNRLHQLGSHPRVCASHTFEKWWTDTSNLAFLTLLYQLSRILLFNRNDRENTKICQCLEIGLATIEGQHFLVSGGREGIKQVLAVHAFNIGNINLSVQLLEHVVEVRKRTLAETHPHRLASQHELAVAYESNGQIQDAVRLLEHVVKVRKQTLAETHLDRLASQHELAVAYKSNGQVQEAVQLLEHVVKVKEQTLAETHPHRLTSQHALATAYKANGQIQDAVRLLEYVVKVEEQTLAETHPDRLASQQALAMAYKSNGQVQEAVQLLEHVVEVRKQTLAETHPHRLSSQHALATAYETNGQIQEAVQLLEHVVKVQEQTLAETHPLRLASEKLLQNFKTLCV